MESYAKFKLYWNSMENHLFDGIVGCAVAASMQRVVLPGTESRETKVRQRVNLSELRKTEGDDDAGDLTNERQYPMESPT